MNIISKIFGDESKKFLKKNRAVVEEINELEKKFRRFSDEELKQKTGEFKKRLREGETLDEIIAETFAGVREASVRTLGQRHYDVQLLAGIALHRGKIAEMKTGEGKTLAATLAVYLNALEGKGVHIVTVNDYLARRDAVWMGQIYDLLGMSVACIAHEASYRYDAGYKAENQKSKIKNQNENEKIKKNFDEERDIFGGFKVVESFLRPCSRKEAYGADITYGTNNEFGFDYLRDNLAIEKESTVQREHHYAIVDEIDSILIDEARTPLIISQPDFEASKMYQDFSRIIPELKENIHYNIDEKLKTATLTEEGVAEIEKILRVENIYEEKGVKYLHYLEQALRAQTLFVRDRDYIIRGGKVIIVDEFTGRLMPGRRWSGGLHQAIEAKERVKVEPESKTLASITFQNYFRLYKKLSGMTGTAKTSEEEFGKVYSLDVIEIPTHKPMIRRDLPDKIFKNEAGKFKAITKEIKERHQKGQPILVGTSSIEKNEYLGAILRRQGIDCQILNAKQHEREGAIIAQAGKLGAVTAATNMAGRGVDIILGGNPQSEEEAEKIKEVGGLFVLGSQRHEARRIDNQLRGRAGRQGDPGESQFFISLEDDLLRIFGSDRLKSFMETLKVPEDEPIEAGILSGAIERAQKTVEGYNFDARAHLLEYDDVTAKHRKKIYGIRKNILQENYQGLRDFVFGILEKEACKLIESHFDEERGFDYQEIFEELKTIIPVLQPVHSKIQEFKDAGGMSKYLNGLLLIFFEDKEKQDGKENMEKVIRFAALRSIDFFWTDHLDAMDYLKDSVRLRAYGGRDPLVEYKTEGHKLFQGLEDRIYSQIARTIFKLSIKT